MGRSRLDWSGWIGVMLVAAVVTGALLAPWLTPYPAEGRGEPHLSAKLLPPSTMHWLGTDEMGRDVLARTLFGGRTALLLAGAVVGLSLAAGIGVGLAAGYGAGWTDGVCMRVADVLLAFPPLLLAVLVVVALGGGMGSAVLALALAWWPVYAVLVRGEVVAVRRRPYIEAARSVGVAAPRLMLRHILPNALRPVLVQAVLDTGAVILVAAGLSFIGLGVEPPAADWGAMINSGRVVALSGKWWVAGVPSLAIMATALGCVLIGDSLQRPR